MYGFVNTVKDVEFGALSDDGSGGPAETEVGPTVVAYDVCSEYVAVIVSMEGEKINNI